MTTTGGVLFEDCCGITVQCNSQQSLDLFNQGLFEYIKGYGDFSSTFEKALELDPNFVLVHCILVCTLLPCRDFICLRLTGSP